MLVNTLSEREREIWQLFIFAALDCSLDMGLILGSGGCAAKETERLQLHAMPVLLCQHQSRLVVEASEVEFAGLFLEPEAGELVVASTARQLLVLVPVANARPHTIFNIRLPDHSRAETTRVSLAPFLEAAQLAPCPRHRAVAGA